MLQRIADGVHVHESACIQSNGIVIQGDGGVLVVDPGITAGELRCLADDIRELRQAVVAGFSTHPDWDHVLWHPELGDTPRYATAAGAAAMRDVLAEADWPDQVEEGLPPEVAGEVPMELFGLLTALEPGAGRVPWDGPAVQVIEHDGHARGHAALLIEDRGVLIAGDMLSDVLVPMPDLYGSAPDPLGDYLRGLDALDAVAGRVTAVVPGHGSVGDAAEFRTRIDRDRAYIQALRDGRAIGDPRVATPKPGWEWVAFIHDGNVERAGGD